MITNRGLIIGAAFLASVLAIGAHSQPKGYQSLCDEAVESLRKEAGDVCARLNDAYQNKNKAEERKDTAAIFSADRKMRLYEEKLESITFERDRTLGQIESCDPSCERWVCGGRYENDTYTFKVNYECTCPE